MSVVILERLSAHEPYRSRRFSGNLRGRSVNASLGIGLDANVLVRRSSRTISLQPLSVVGLFGINLALGVAALGLY